jgi:hypothetical protein
MMFKMTDAKYTPDPTLERALDVLFILHADHEQNCSTNADARDWFKPAWIPTVRWLEQRRHSMGRCTAERMKKY